MLPLAITEDRTGRFNVDDLNPGASSPSETPANVTVVQDALDIAARVEWNTYDYDALPQDLVQEPGAAANGPFCVGPGGGYTYDAATNFTYEPASGAILYEEYHPFGTSAYRAVDSTVEVSPKRYRYAAAERDEETGLLSHQTIAHRTWRREEGGGTIVAPARGHCARN